MSLSNRQRIALAAACDDTAGIPKVDGAGVVFEEEGVRFQRMHNGLRVVADGYYGQFVTEIIARLRGHHEPQEEKVFSAVLEHLPEAPTMLELGGYWSYYSMWMLKQRPAGRAIVVEPISHRMEVGRHNLAANGLRATLIQAAIGDVDGPEREFRTGDQTSFVRTRSVDSIAAELAIRRIHILHIDVQGFERLALEGAGKMLACHEVDWVFVSTHRHLEEAAATDLHQACLNSMTGHGYRIVAEHSPEESFSVDGLIVSKALGVPGPDHVDVARCGPEHIALAMKSV